jgi:hypothetical protein
MLTPIIAVLFRKSRKLAYVVLAAVLVVMHLIILFEISHWGMSNCDQLTHGHGRRLQSHGISHVHGDSGPFRGSFQDSKYTFNLFFCFRSRAVSSV